jgi:hypothetical protein
MGCGCGGGKRNVSSRRATTVAPRAASQVRPATQAVQNLSISPVQNERQEIERKRRIQISLRRKNGQA